MPARLEFRADHVAGIAGNHSKAYQRRRHGEVLEGAGHGVLAANGRSSELQLRTKTAKHRRKGLAPTLGDKTKTLEILLEGKARTG